MDPCDVSVYFPSFCWVLFSLPTQGQLRLSRPRCLVLCRGGLSVQKWSPIQALSAWHKVTALTKTNLLPLSQTGLRVLAKGQHLKAECYCVLPTILFEFAWDKLIVYVFIATHHNVCSTWYVCSSYSPVSFTGCLMYWVGITLHGAFLRRLAVLICRLWFFLYLSFWVDWSCEL